MPASTPLHRAGRLARKGAHASPRNVDEPGAEKIEQALLWIDQASCIVGAVLALRLALRFARLKTTRHAASSQRLIAETGLLRTIKLPFELNSIGLVTQSF